MSGKTEELVQLHNGHAKPGTGLFCVPCDVKVQKRGFTEQPDGTITHNRCGKPLDLAAPQPTSLVPRRRPARIGRRAKTETPPRKGPRTTAVPDAVLAAVQGLAVGHRLVLQHTAKGWHLTLEASE